MFLLDRGEGAKNPREKREKEKREAGASKKQACLSAGEAKRVLAFSGITCLSLDARRLDRGEGAKNPHEKREREKREAGALKKQACLSAGEAKRVLAFSGSFPLFPFFRGILSPSPRESGILSPSPRESGI